MIQIEGKTLIIDPKNATEKSKINLTADGSAWIVIENLPEELVKYGITNFEEMLKYCPSEKSKLVIKGQELQSDRYHRSYLNTPDYSTDCTKAYMFSGKDVSENRKELPECFEKFYKHMKEKDLSYNQVVVNWYLNNLDFIPYHTDCTVGMIDNPSVATVTFNKGNDDVADKCRIFSLKPKEQVVNDNLYERVRIVLRHGSIITMCGDTQKKFLHGVLKSENEDAYQRISLSFRQFKVNTDI